MNKYPIEEEEKNLNMEIFEIKEEILEKEKGK